MKQIFINLIGNAFKFTDNGVIEGGCKINDNGVLVFYVSDTGIGIPYDKQKVVFERFIQIGPETNKLFGGTGLGLSIVKGLVKLLGGELWLESEPEKGSTFSFTISYKIGLTLNLKPLALHEHEACHFPGKTILIVEDDIYNAEYLKEILVATELNILYALNGNEAIKICLEQQIDIVLMDIGLPDIDGYDAIRQIKMNNPGLKVIAQTAFAHLEDRTKAINVGCIDYISKPINQELLLSMLTKHLSSR